MKAIVTLIVLTFLTACSKDNETEKVAVFFDTAVEISLKDHSGIDMLNPNNQNAYRADEIKIYYLVNGEKQEIFDPNMDYPRNFLIYQNENEYRIRIFQNSVETEELPITYVEWNENETDTLQAEYDRTYNNQPRVQKVWFNGELKWDGQNGEKGFFTIIK
ncbi:hypothetical protein H4O20_02300 [Aequorivita sp. 609]|uniref:hypothetical protein n=1 Tax=Aequorivita TaxID=153265 RepID=UPI001123CC9D|nr:MULTISPECIES: hypothetical protein [Aequorivita]MBB6680266.1 hypothetical protein [Aequorivita sp. 609]MCZ4319727.1 hypothetical protein [Aequorivita viscosa]